MKTTAVSVPGTAAAPFGIVCGAGAARTRAEAEEVV